MQNLNFLLTNPRNYVIINSEMFPKIIRTKYGNRYYDYLRLVENYRVNGKIKQKVIAKFGNLESIATRDKIEDVIVALSKFTQRRLFSIKDLTTKLTASYGDVLLIRHLWDKLQLTENIKKHLYHKKVKFNYWLCILVMVINRLIAPGSKLKVTQWQNKIYLPELQNNKPRYQHYLRSLNYLYEIKEKLEYSIFNLLIDLFSIELNLIFYDITSSYFEGTKCNLAEFGYSRDHRSDARQIVLGLLVTNEGIPIAHEVFEGSRADKTTLQNAIEYLKFKFKIKKCIFVCDRGMISQENLQALGNIGYEYIVALKKRRSLEVNEIFRVAPKKYQKLEENLLIKEITHNNMRYFICYNPQKAHDDQIFREQLIQRTEEKLVNLYNQVRFGKLKDNKLIITRAGEILSAVKEAKKYFSITSSKDGEFYFEVRNKIISQEKNLDGIYVIKTNCFSLSPKEVISSYKNLAEVEEAFKEIKDFLHLRPIYLWNEVHVRSHVFICVLAYLIEKIIDNRLKNAGINFSSRTALEKLAEVRLLENQIKDVVVKTITELTKEQKCIFNTFGISYIPKIILPENIKM